ncbi:MAG TPA: stage 0 sporulation protein [Lentisphaeria bacterium]|nr:MAG: hypothetical protein A2X45_09485 [Lentisphaerae bacterium GWF2_50_93]HCE42032.1 stage 0 sporulation protein [Lentisphaeria bacterium]
MDPLYDIKIETGATYVASAPSSMSLKAKDFVVVRKDKILDYGQIITCLGEKVKLNDKDKEELPVIDRKATVNDQGKANENLMRSKSAFRTAIQYILNLKLPMKLLNAHYSFDMKLVTFQFTADGRVDFRELVKQLSQGLNTRIELRQIGVRDETALIGGFGVCGLELCCCKFLRTFASINVRMAKEQDLSLNPNNISGICGRLKCCLKYEHAGYQELDRDMPRRGACCECAEGRGRVIDRNLLTQKVTLHIDETGKTTTYPKEDVRIVYLDKYKVAPEHGDVFDGLDDDQKRILKQLNDE